MNIRMIKRSDTWCDRLGALGILLMLTVFYSLLTDVAGALDPMLFPGWKVIVPAFIKSIGALGRIRLRIFCRSWKKSRKAELRSSR